MNSRRMSSSNLVGGMNGNEIGNNFNPAMRSESRTASIASSETSETQSVSDESGGTNARSNRGAKKPKEPERPPWRATVSVAAPPKVDKSALLRAKLLDASRRIVRASKNPSIGVQTDKVPTKLVREVSIGVQDDLVQFEDKECLTDGTITIKDKFGNLVLTHSVSQMTDAIVNRDSQTQTALPRNNVKFDRNIVTSDDGYTTFNQIRKNEEILTNQINELIKIDEKLHAVAGFNENTTHQAKQYDNGLQQNDFTNDSSNQECDKNNTNFSDFETDSISDNESNGPNTSHQKRSKQPNTRNFWHNIDFSSDEDDYPPLPRRYMTNGKSTWCDLKDLVLGQRVSQMRLSPIPPRRARPNLKRVSWSDAQHRLVSNLVTEANALMEMFDQVSMLLGPDIKLHDIPQIGDNGLPPFEMDSALTKSCDLLEQKINQIQPIVFRESQIFSQDLRQYENYDINNNSNEIHVPSSTT